MLTGAAVVSASAQACSIPVFRYALEQWRPDPYVAFVFHRGELTEEQQKLITAMQPKAFDGLPAANLFVKTVNVETELEGDEVLSRVWKENQTDQLPHLVIHAPPKWGAPPTIFQGALTAANVAALMESPLRTTIKDRLLKGDSVVWVYLECGRKAEDDVAYGLLEAELKRLQAVIELPAIDEADLKDLSVTPDQVKLKFSAVRVSRGDAKEQMFREMLLNVEPDLKSEEYVDEPMAFPVFGRGRALYALVGDGVAPDLIEEACRFLTGACQCTVKRENPGVDLLMQVDWDRYVQPTEAVGSSLPPLAGFSGFGAVGDESDDEKLKGLPAQEEDASEPVNGNPAESAETSDTGAGLKATSVVEAPAESTPEQAHDTSAMSWNVVYVLLLAGIVVMVLSLFLRQKTTS